MESLHIVKAGGALLDTPRMLEQLLEKFVRIKGFKILVHGGGRRASNLARQMGVAPKLIEGRRVTDRQTLEIVQMVYAGLINKNLVARLQAQNCRALGLSGADVDSIRAVKRPVEAIDYGFVGDVQRVHTGNICKLLSAGFVPVFCALSHDGQGQMLNTNADTIAAELAAGFGAKYAVRLFYCFDKPGVLARETDPESLISHVTKSMYRRMKQEQSIHGGMLPKLANAFYALEHGVKSVHIGPVDMLVSETIGTRITLE